VKRLDRPWLWIDLENTPHVLFLEPFVVRLRREGWDVRVTAKPQSQTLELAAARGLRAQPVGHGDFAGLIEKLVGGGRRAFALLRWLARESGRPSVLLSSSRSACLAAFIARVPAITLLDYEHSELRPFALGARVWLPDVLRSVALPSRLARLARFYPGLKENLYLDDWQFDRVAERRALSAGAGDYLVVARPPAATAHYANDRSEQLWFAAIEGVLAWPQARVVLSPRTNLQYGELRSRLSAHRAVTILERVVPGPGLVAAADLVIGGGGTMNREAAVLGVPVWSVFCGPTPRIDVVLSAEGRLRWVRSEPELGEALVAGPPKLGTRRGPFPDGFAAIYDDICAQLRIAASPIASPPTTVANLSL
jgi:uncharacterized protein